jgi:phosphopantetheinyl transferase (holo-ACP synthase)
VALWCSDSAVRLCSDIGGELVGTQSVSGHALTPFFKRFSPVVHISTAQAAMKFVVLIRCHVILNLSYNLGLHYLATRSSTKEAFSKAVGMRTPMTWRHCEIANAQSCKPVIVLHGALKEWFEAQGLTAYVTVMDGSEYAASFCVVEKL